MLLCPFSKRKKLVFTICVFTRVEWIFVVVKISWSQKNTQNTKIVYMVIHKNIMQKTILDYMVNSNGRKRN